MTATAQKSNGRARVPRVVEAPQPEPATPATGSANVELMAAILRVQAALPKLATNADGQVGGRSYRYADLGQVTDAALPLLVTEQLAWVTFPTSDEHGAPALRYRITHLPSAEFEEDVMPLMCAKPDPQGQGSALTYSRRYALGAVLNITIGDDDGAAASQNGGQNAEQNAQPTAKTPASSERPATAKQRGMLRAKARDADLSPERFANVLLAAAGGEVTDWADEAAASRWLDRNLDRFPANAVDAAVEGIAHAAAEGSHA